MVGFIAHLFVEWLRTGLGADLRWGVPGHAAPGDFRESQPPPQTAKMNSFAIASGSSQRSPLRAGIGCSRIHAPTATHLRRLSRAKPSLVKDRFTSPFVRELFATRKRTGMAAGLILLALMASLVLSRTRNGPAALSSLRFNEIQPNPMALFGIAAVGLTAIMVVRHRKHYWTRGR